MAGKVFTGRFSADLDGDFVVFVIGMRVNRPFHVRGWWPTFRAMGPMLKELEADPALLYSHTGWMGGPALIQYWRSFADLDRYARDGDREHLPAWREWVHGISRSSGSVGIWHETYKVRAGEYEAIYGNTPRIGLAQAGAHVPLAVKGASAARRIGATEEDVPAVAYPG